MKFGLTAAVIGSGYMGEKYLEILSCLADCLILCSNDEEKGKALAKKYNCEFYTDYNLLYNDKKPDFVCVCLPTHLHCDATVKALNSGFHVLCEKPLEKESFSKFFGNDDSLFNELNYFCHIIESGSAPSLCPPEETLATMLLSHSESISLNSGKEVKIC